MSSNIFEILFVFLLSKLLTMGFAAPASGRNLVNAGLEADPELAAGLFEGDIVMQAERNGLMSSKHRWPNKTVFYRINNHFDEPHLNYIKRGMEIIESVSCVRFLPAPVDQKYYINITGNDDGCYSHVGWMNKVQIYNLQNYPLDTGCFRIGTILHEFLHALGFYHMQSSWDRDEYVWIAEENVKEGKLHNFKKYNKDQVDSYDQAYDYGSVMHYSAYAFSANGEMTIVPLREEEAAEEMGQRKRMSASDIDKLNSMYRCPIKL